MTLFRDRCITFFTDNEALVHVINKSTCTDTSLMIFLRTCKLVLVCLKHNILFKAKHISGFKNTLADALSRLQDRTFHENRSTSLYGSHANSNPIPSTPVKLASIVMIFYLLVYRSLQYQRTVGHGSFICEEFQISVFQSSHISLPVLRATLALFVAHVFNSRYASSTVNNYVSTPGYKLDSG